VAFSDNKNSVSHSGVLSRALLYVQNFDGLVCSFPHDKSIAGEGKMHEGKQSTSLGLKPIPSLAEEIQISRDLYLTAYNEAKIHFSAISSKGSVKLIKDAKNKGLKVSCEIPAHQLFFTDSNLEDFDSIHKVLPPYREEGDKKALIKGLVDGTIEVISSDHTPEDTENKLVEFDQAAFGIIGLQTLFPVVNTVLKDKMDLSDMIAKFCQNPRNILGLEKVSIEEKSEANLTLFDPEKNWELTKDAIQSKSYNSPFIGMELKGSVVGIVNRGQIKLN